MASDQEEKERDQLIFELIKRRLDGEWQRLRDLDDKASNLIGFVSVATGVLLGTGMLGLVTLDTINPLAAFFFFAGTGLLITSIIFSLYGFKIRDWHDAPDVNYLVQEYKSKPYTQVLRRVAGEMKKVVVEMEIKLNEKAHYISIAWYLLIAGLILVFIFVLIMVNSG